ncbi:zinc-ribbon domain-containing protein [Candidatus Gracilibacteria bacterium]|nr:zinc-ribbon domain-containing protein [Candidatus Gracilibacteria bacterium]
MKYCPKCGNQTIDEAKFCLKCGSAFDFYETKLINTKINNETNTSYNTDLKISFKKEYENEIKNSKKARFGLLLGLRLIFIILLMIGNFKINKYDNSYYKDRSYYGFYSYESSGYKESLSTKETGEMLNFFGYIFGIIMGIVGLCYLYRIWLLIQDKNVTMTPGIAIGYLFIPFFNFYWVFKCCWGLSIDYNKFIKKYNLNLKKMPELLFLVESIVFVLLIFPILGVKEFIGYTFFALVILATIADYFICLSINELLECYNKNNANIFVNINQIQIPNSHNLQTKAWYQKDLTDLFFDLFK